MSLTVIGAVLILVISLCFLKDMLNDKGQELLKLSYFFVPFSGVSLYNIPANSFYILPFTVTAGAWIFSELLLAIRKKSATIINVGNFVVILLLLFGVAVALSSLAPIFINGADGYYGLNADVGRYFPIMPSSIHLLQLIYVVIGLLFTILVIGSLNTPKKVEVIIRIVMISGAFTCVLGLIELVAFYLGLDYQTGWYHTVPTGDGSEKSVRIDGLLGIARINSVAYETSNFAQHMLVIYAFIYYCRAEKLVIFSQSKDRTISFLILFSLVMSISSTALFGLAIIYILYWALSSWTIKRVFIAFINFVFVASVLYVAYSQIPAIADIVDAFILNKFNSGSALSRFSASVNGLELFWRHPLIGIGFGVGPSSDLVIMLLSGVGIVGFMIFFLLV